MEEDAVKHFVGKVDGLAFLPVAHTQAGVAYLHNNTPPGTPSLTIFLFHVAFILSGVHFT